MAIYHCSMKPISRSGGRSAVAAVAYRTATRLLNERDGLIHDFTAKRGVEHKEIVLPNGMAAEWAQDRSLLWNAAERSEHRKDARVAREFEVALPHELSGDEQIALTREFARDLADRYGAAVDFAIHRPSGESDIRNSHAHILMTTRTVGASGFGDKTLLERENKWLLNHNVPTAQMQLRDIRQSWEHYANRHLARAGREERIDHRSHQERGLEIEPTEHIGVHASQMDRRGRSVSRARIDEKAARRNVDLIRKKPEQILTLITGEKSVFDRHDVARALHRYINDPRAFQNAFAAVMASPALVELQPEQKSELARYSTREMIHIEAAMAASAARMMEALDHAVQRHHVEQALGLQDEAVRARAAASTSGQAKHGERPPADGEQASVRSGLSQEQRAAVHHMTGPEQIAAVIGFAGAGKSTMLAAAREAWERQGFRVHGAALAGKAAEGLEDSSGIASRTLASWEYGWQAQRGLLGRGDVLVIDEAGMIGSRQLARFVTEAEARGAKLVLVGDHEQLQAIGAGSPFRAIAERVGAVELSEIRRQKEDWQREASIAFATHRTGQGLAAYAERGALRQSETRDQVRSALARDYVADLEERPLSTRIALAHRRADVQAINAEVRALLQERGRLGRGEQGHSNLGREVTYQTNDGRRSFAPGDRIVLLENNRDLGVKNGMLGTVHAVEPDALQIRLDGAGQGYAGAVSIPAKSYQAFDHGYATTIHKSQGSTVDRAFVMASATMDRHLAYVAMTRHRDSVQLYAGRDEFEDLKALTASMSRSGAKETTLDYAEVLAARRGIPDAFDLPSNRAVIRSPGRPEERPAAHYGASGERVRSPAALQPSAAISVDQGREELAGQIEKVEPLVPAITSYDLTIDDVAREKARPDLERQMDMVRSVAQGVYKDPEHVAQFADAIMDGSVTGTELAKAIAEQPERFGELRGGVGLLGENKERKLARFDAQGLSMHVLNADEIWKRRVAEERGGERWYRRKRDVVEVPGLTRRSETLLMQLDRLPQSEKAEFLKQLYDTDDGRQALEEAKIVVRALERRFGSADYRDVGGEMRRLGCRTHADEARIMEIVRITSRAERMELSRQYEQRRTLGRGLSVGLGL